MNGAADPPPPRRDRRPQRSPVFSIAVRVAALLAALAIGLAIGQTLDDNPAPGTQTIVRTLKPLEVPPAPETVTVTVSASTP